MKRGFSIIATVIICLLVAVVSYFWVTALMDSIYVYRSPLKDSAPKPGEMIARADTRSVVIVLIDALRYDTSNNSAVMPYLNELRNMGAYAEMHSRVPSYSEPGYTVILTGAWPDVSDGPVINLDYADIPTFTQDDIFSAVHRAGLLTAVSGFNWFEKLIPQAAVTKSFYTAGEDQIADRDVIDAALPWLREGKYSLVLIHIDQVDYAGHHEGGPIDPRWDTAATRADGLLKEIASEMDFSRDTLIVISDHGQIIRGGHGGQDAINLIEPFVMAGKDVLPGKYSDIQMVDIAPTVAAILGTNIPATNQGKPRVEMLDFSLDRLSEINEILSKQQDQLATDYETALIAKITNGDPKSQNRLKLLYENAFNKTLISQQDSIAYTVTAVKMEAARNSLVVNEQIIRGIIGIIFAVVIIYLAFWYTRTHSQRIFVGILVYLVIFHAKYIFLDHKTYSLSSVSSGNELIISTAINSIIAIVVGWVIVLAGTKAFQNHSERAADITLKFILATLSILAVPIIANYIVDGITVTWALPSFLFSFLGVLFLIQTLVIAIIGLLLVGVSAVIDLFKRGNFAHQEN